MTYETILFSIEGGIARLTLNRPTASTASTTRCTQKCARYWIQVRPTRRFVCCS
jgi:enoyl-CoA hydratase/carnithine racemase